MRDLIGKKIFSVGSTRKKNGIQTIRREWTCEMSKRVFTVTTEQSYTDGKSIQETVGL